MGIRLIDVDKHDRIMLMTVQSPDTVTLINQLKNKQKYYFLLFNRHLTSYLANNFLHLLYY